MSQCLLLIFLIFSSFCFGQEVKYSIEIMPTAFGNRMNIPDEADTTILYGFNDVQIWAKPLRGWMKFRERFDNLEYPDEAKKLGIECDLTVYYVVDKTGEMSDIRVVETTVSPLDADCNSFRQEIRRFFFFTPWRAALINGVPVNSKNEMRISFSIIEPQ